MDSQVHQRKPLLNELADRVVPEVDSGERGAEHQAQRSWPNTAGQSIHSYSVADDKLSIGSGTEVKRGGKFSHLSNVLRWWWIEILCCLASTSALVAQVMVLERFDGKPQHNWTNTKLTLNGLIAILATVCRAALMIPVASVLSQSKWTRFIGKNKKGQKLAEYGLLDEASRGSYGSLQVLWRFKGFLHISCLGAVITIASLALSTFSQQIILLHTETIPSKDFLVINKTGAPPWSNRFTEFASNALPTGEGDLTIPMKLAILNGLMAPSISPLPISCPTGNCTWAPFTTLGVCGSCSNITKDISCTSSTRYGPYCELPIGIQIGTKPNGSTPMVFAVTNTRKTEPSRDNKSRPDHNILANFTMMGFSDRWTPTSFPLPVAYECSLQLCVQARQLEVKSGEQIDSITSTWSKMRIGGYLTSPVPFVDLPSSEFSVPDGVTFEAGKLMPRMFEWFLRPMFEGNITQDYTKGDLRFTSDHVQALQPHLAEPDKWIYRFAESMTNSLREQKNGGEVLYRYNGTAHVNQVNVVVRWEWFLFPTILVFLSILYLIIEITRTVLSDIRPWKSDPLVPLYASLDLDHNVLSAAAVGLNKPDGLMDELGDFDVRLDVGSESGLRFSGKMVLDEEEKHGSVYGRVEQASLDRQLN